MSEIHPGRGTRRIAVLVLSALAIASPRSEAQTAAGARHELDSLLPHWRAATARLVDAEHGRRRSAGAILAQRGHLHIVADSAIAAVVSEAAGVASASLDRVFGSEAHRASSQPIVARLQRVVHKGDSTLTIRVQRTGSEDRALGRGDARRAPSEERVVAIGSPDGTRSDLVAALEALAAVPLHAALDDDLRFWFRSALPATPESSTELEGIYIDLTTSSTAISRGCLVRDVTRCRQALGLAPIPDPILDGYTASQRHAIVVGNPERLRVPAKAAEYDRCVTANDDAACINRLRDLTDDRLSRGLSSTAARRSFARWAIARGGSGAYSRLRSSSHLPLVERFAAAAGLPVDSVVASWHDHVVSARPTDSGIPPLDAMATLLWIGACGALSLRSSKWR